MSARAGAARIAALALTLAAGTGLAEEPEEVVKAASDPVSPPHYARAAFEELLLLSLGTTWYWLDDRNVVDWDDPAWSTRFTGEAWRFDNNTFPINYLWHPINGSGYHVVARANGLGMLGTVGYGFATSFAWEYLIEFKEKVSINDVIVTTGAGVAIGEFVYWLGSRLGYPGWGHELLDGHPPARPPVDGRFALSAALGSPFGELRLAGDLVPRGGPPTALSLRIPFDDGKAGVDLLADTWLWGTPVGPARLGTSISYHYRHLTFDDWSERLGLMHLPGFAGVVAVGPLQAWARANLAFSGLDAPAHDAWAAAHPGLHEKTVLDRHGYYYGWGASGRLGAEVSHPLAAAGGSLFYGRYASVEGLDRNQEELTADVPARDTLRELEGWLRVGPFHRVYLQGRVIDEQRKHRVGNVRVGVDRTLYLLELGVTL